MRLLCCSLAPRGLGLRMYRTDTALTKVLQRTASRLHGQTVLDKLQFRQNCICPAGKSTLSYFPRRCLCVQLHHACTVRSQSNFTALGNSCSRQGIPSVPLPCPYAACAVTGLLMTMQEGGKPPGSPTRPKDAWHGGQLWAWGHPGQGDRLCCGGPLCDSVHLC